MTGFLIAIGIGLMYTLYAGWSAPVMRENEDGSWTTIRPEKKFSDLFKKTHFDVDLNDQRLGMDFVPPKRKYVKKKK
jgi:hypothetical protein